MLDDETKLKFINMFCPEMSPDDKYDILERYEKEEHTRVEKFQKLHEFLKSICEDDWDALTTISSAYSSYFITIYINEKDLREELKRIHLEGVDHIIRSVMENEND